MAVMKSEYINGRFSHSLTVDRDEVIRFAHDGYQLRVIFSNLDSQVMGGWVPTEDVDDKSKYWKTEELVKQLKEMRAHFERLRDIWKEKDNGLGLALKYSQRVAALDEILSNLENGENIWED
jgi:hypothetical protein